MAQLRIQLLDLHENPRLVPPFTDGVPALSPAEGYAAAAALHERRLALGWRAAGRKIGFTNRTIWPRYGVYEPIWGWMYDRSVSFAEGDRASVPLQGLLQPRIEPEVCVGLRAAPRTARPEDLLDAIEWVAHGCEIVQCPHPGWKLKLADCTAFNGLHGRLVVGSRVPVGDLPGLEKALPALEMVLMKGGAVVDRGTGSNVLDSPLNALAYLVEVLAKQPGALALQAGEIVTTGTITDAHPVAAGESWSTALSGIALPGLRIDFK